MNDFVCSFCNHAFHLNYSTYHEQNIRFEFGYQENDTEYSLKVRLYNCPHCGKISSFIDYTGESLPEKTIPIYPISSAKQYPEYIPEAIRNDYEEACAISSLSPKASATLARRCLQGMIRDYWNISGKNNLFEEINAIEDMISPSAKAALDGLRKVGNIGAHMEKDINLIIDIDQGEAEKLLRLIEFLVKEWYINRYESEQLLKDVINISADKDSQR